MSRELIMYMMAARALCHAFESLTLLLLFFSSSSKVLVPGTINNAFLDNLIPDTPYNINVVALYADGEGPPVTGSDKTRKFITRL